MPRRRLRSPLVDPAQVARIDALFARMDALVARRKAGTDPTLDAEIERTARELEVQSRSVRGQAAAYRDAMRQRVWQGVAVLLLGVAVFALVFVLGR